MTEKEIKEIVSRESVGGVPLSKKIIAKIPDVAVGDVVQIEWSVKIFYARQFSAIFFYNEFYPVLYSNLYITLPGRDMPTFFSFPENKIGQPQILEISKEFGAGNTYF